VRRFRPDADADDDTTTITVSLDLFGAPQARDFDVPAEATSPRRLLPVVRELAEMIVAEGVRRATEQGLAVSCRAGCGACCRQLVPISRTEARALLELVDALPEPRRTEVRARFEEARRQLTEAGLLERLRDLSWVRGDEAEALALEYLRAGIPCPFLEDGAGRTPSRLEEGGCAVYEERPVVCREYLVTSPPEECRAPTRDAVRLVALAGALSEQIPHMEGSPPHRGPAWIPLALSLEWAAAHPEEAPRRTGPELVEALLTRRAAPRGRVAPGKRAKRR
jgi:Fe-S-cluster containining protein